MDCILKVHLDDLRCTPGPHFLYILVEFQFQETTEDSWAPGDEAEMAEAFKDDLRGRVCHENIGSFTMKNGDFTMKTLGFRHQPLGLTIKNDDSWGYTVVFW